jgi:hypothetical protein
MLLIQPLMIRLSPGVGHVFSSDEPLQWEFRNRGPGRALIEQTVLSPGESATFSRSEPITMISWDDRDTDVDVQPAFS